MVVAKKKVNRRDLLLVKKGDDWSVRFADSKHPIGYFFGDEYSAREKYDRIGRKVYGEYGPTHSVFRMDDRFKSRKAGNKKSCPNGYVEIRGKCRKTNPVKTHHHSDELSQLTTTSPSSHDVLSKEEETKNSKAILTELARIAELLRKLGG